MFLARTVRKIRWEENREGLADGDLSAWGITFDLRAENNEISLWSCGDGGEEARREAALALAAQGRNEPDRLEIVWLDAETLEADGHVIEQTMGSTSVHSLADTHRDLKAVNQTRLIEVGKRVVEAIRDGRFQRFTPTEVTKLLAEAVRDGRLDVDQLQGKLKEAVRKEIVKEGT